jgi:uncharacterized OsmC-like protein
VARIVLRRRPMATREVVVNSGPGLSQTINAGPHTLRGDEPIETGGQDTGPTPYELLLAALGSCTSMTLRQYARTQAWPLERVTVRLEHWKVESSGHNGGETSVDEIKKVVFLVGDLTTAQRTRLLDVAEKCPLHRTLAKAVRIRTLLGKDAGA